MKQSRRVPSWTSSPAVLSPKTCENFHSSGDKSAADLAGAKSPSPPTFIYKYSKKLTEKWVEKRENKSMQRKSIWETGFAWISRIRTNLHWKINAVSAFFFIHSQPYAYGPHSDGISTLSLCLCLWSLLFFFFLSLLKNRGEENDAAGRSFLADFVVDI